MTGSFWIMKRIKTGEIREREPTYDGKTYEEAIRKRSVLESRAIDMTSSIIYSPEVNDHPNDPLDTDSEADEMLERADEAALEFGMSHHMRKRYTKNG